MRACDGHPLSVKGSKLGDGTGAGGVRHAAKAE